MTTRLTIRFRSIVPLVALTLLAFVSIAGPVRGQQAGQADPLFTLDQLSRVQIEAIQDSARLTGLPTRLIHSKALEGVAKHASGPTVLREVRKLYGDVKASKKALGASDDEAIEAGAEALYAQVMKPEELSEFKPGPNGHSPVQALTYLSDLIQYRGVGRDEAMSAFVKLWKDGASDELFKGLWQRVDQDILSGVNPVKAFQNQVRAIPPHGGLPAPTPAAPTQPAQGNPSV